MMTSDGNIDTRLVVAATDNTDLFGLDAYKDVSILYSKRVFILGGTDMVPTLHNNDNGRIVSDLNSARASN